MIVITGVAFETLDRDDKVVVLSASWLDGQRFQYYISRSGVVVEGLKGKPQRKSAMLINSFSIAVHDDVWSLFLHQRFDPLLRTIDGLHEFFFHRESQPLQREDIGTAFGVGNARQLADALREMGYRVREMRWVDMLRSGAAALQAAD